jgi:hypothetical protein
MSERTHCFLFLPLPGASSEMARKLLHPLCMGLLGPLATYPPKERLTLHDDMWPKVSDACLNHGPRRDYAIVITRRSVMRKTIIMRCKVTRKTLPDIAQQPACYDTSACIHVVQLLLGGSVSRFQGYFRGSVPHQDCHVIKDLGPSAIIHVENVWPSLPRG